MFGALRALVQKKCYELNATAFRDGEKGVSMQKPRRYSAATLLRQVYRFLRSAWDSDSRRPYRRDRRRTISLTFDSLEERDVPSGLLSATTLSTSDNSATYGQVVTFSASV